MTCSESFTEGGEVNLMFEPHTHEQQAGDYAFEGTTLGNTTTNPELNQKINIDKIRDKYESFYADYINPSNMYISVSNCANHNQMKGILEDILHDSQFEKSPPNCQTRSRPFQTPVFRHKAQIVQPKTAGSRREGEQEDPFNHVYLSWEGVPWNHPDAYVFHVLKWMFGTGSEFNEGGPGSGMHCRFRYLVHSMQGIGQVSSIVKMFKDTGLFGVYIRCDADKKSTQDSIMEAFLCIMDALDQVDEEEVKRARNCQALKTLMNLERQIERVIELTYNQYVI